MLWLFGEYYDRIQVVWSEVYCWDVQHWHHNLGENCHFNTNIGCQGEQCQFVAFLLPTLRSASLASGHNCFIEINHHHQMSLYLILKVYTAISVCCVASIQVALLSRTFVAFSSSCHRRSGQWRDYTTLKQSKLHVLIETPQAIYYIKHCPRPTANSRHSILIEKSVAFSPGTSHRKQLHCHCHCQCLYCLPTLLHDMTNLVWN